MSHHFTHVVRFFTVSQQQGVQLTPVSSNSIFYDMANYLSKRQLN